MNQLSVTLSILGGLLLLVGLAAFLYAVFRGTAQEKRIERQASEITGYIQRLDYVEPRLVTLEQQNSALLLLHDPTADRQATKAEHDKIIQLLQAQSRTLAEMHKESSE